MGKIRLTLCLSSSPSTVWSLFLAFHSNELIPPPVEKLLDVLIPRLADSQSFWSIRYHARGEIAFLRIFARDKLEMSKYFIGYDIIRDIVNKPVREFVGNHEIFLFLFSNWFERRSRTTTVSNSIWEGKSGGVTEIRVFYYRTDLRGSSNATNSRYKRDGCCDAHFPDRVFHTREFSHTRKSITDNSSYFKIVVDNLSVWKITTSIRSLLFLLEATIFTLVVSFNFKMKQTSSLFFPSTRDITKGKKIKEE